MARTKSETEDSTTPDLEFVNLPAVTDAINGVTTSDIMVMQSFEVAKLLGRIETANFFTTVGDKVIAETAISIKESKQFKGLPYFDENKELRHIGTFDEFCKVFLKKSYSRTMELISNHKQLDADLYEKAEVIGFTQKDYNTLKALPSDDQLIVKQAIEAQDRDTVIDLLQEMAAKHQREKEKHQKEVTELKEDSDSKDKVIKAKQELNERLNKDLAETQEQLSLQKQSPELIEKQLIANVEQVGLDIYSKIGSQLLSDIVTLFKHFDNTPPEHIRLIANQQLGMIITQCYDIANDLGAEPLIDANKAAEDPAKQDAEDFANYEAPDYSNWQPADTQENQEDMPFILKWDAIGIGERKDLLQQAGMNPGNQARFSTQSGSELSVKHVWSELKPLLHDSSIEQTQPKNVFDLKAVDKSKLRDADLFEDGLSDL